MPVFGAHMSISGGCENAVYSAAEIGFKTVQLFSKNSNQWKAKPLSEEDGQKFQAALKKTSLQTPLIHDSYLINLASVKSDLLEKSKAAFANELLRASILGVEAVVMHPGSYTEDTPENGLRRIASALEEILKNTPKSVSVYLETTAGQGTNLGCRFEELAEIISLCSENSRLAVCLDTCHVFAAGYAFGTPNEYRKMMSDFDKTVGLSLLKAFHLNDSVKDVGCRVDRHAPIGKGKIGLEAFRLLLNDPCFESCPMYLETPKGTFEENGKIFDWDTVNLQILQNLIKK